MSELRAHPRAPIALEVVYSRMNAFFADYTRDISKGGVFIRTDKSLEVGAELSFTIKLPGKEEPIALKGRVMWTRPPGDAGPDRDRGGGMGIRFIWDDDQDRIRFEELVEALMAEVLGGAISKQLLERGQT